jgi:UDP-GlcNAc:undecaprenyl-phosphate/decaprenyl-phosphate GlcNAc-1-phosphate transferase
VSKELAIYAWLFIVAFLCTLILTPLSVRLAVAIGAVDYPNDRKIHVQPTPRLGGVAIAGSILVTLIVGCFINAYIRSALPSLAGVIISLTG